MLLKEPPFVTVPIIHYSNRRFQAQTSYPAQRPVPHGAEFQPWRCRGVANVFAKPQNAKFAGLACFLRYFNHFCKSPDIIMTNDDFNWPKKGDRAFMSYISKSEQLRLEAFIFPCDEGAYLFGYKRAADMIVDAAQHDDMHPDALFFPVAYLYRHYLELTMKGIVHDGIRMGAIEDTRKYLVEHNLHKLWNKVRQLIEQVWPDSPNNDIKAVEQVILELHKLDQSSQTFRYPRDKEGNSHLKKMPERVDLHNLRLVMDAVSNFLEAAWDGISE